MVCALSGNILKQLSFLYTKKPLWKYRQGLFAF